MIRVFIGAMLFSIALFGGCARQSVPLAMHIGSPWVEGRIGDSPAWFLVDTGASITVLDRGDAIEHAALNPGTRTLFSTTGKLQAPTARVGTMSIDGAAWNNRLVTVANLESYSAPGGRHGSALLGSDMMLDYNAIFDIKRGRFSLSKKEAPTRGGLSDHDLLLVDGIPMVPVRVGDNALPAWARLDTGSGFRDERCVYLELSRLAARDMLGPIIDGTPDDRYLIQGLSGTEEVDVYRGITFEIFGTRFEEACAVVHGTSGLFAEAESLLVSGNVLAHFEHVEIDYPRRRIWVGKQREIGTKQ